MIKHTRKLVISFLVFFQMVLGKEPLTVFLLWQHSPNTTMTIQWITPLDSSEDLVEFQKTNENTWNQKNGIHFPLPPKHPFLLHRVELTGLQPDTEYFFRIGNGKKIYKFKTLPLKLDKTLSFVAGGDIYHDGKEILSQINKAAAKKNPDFALMGGDLAYAGGRSSFLYRYSLSSEKINRWLDWLIAWNQEMITEEGRLIPIIYTLGNHDVMGRYHQTPSEALLYYALFPTANNSGYYVLDVGDYLSFVVLDTDHTHPIEGQQTKWLFETLAKRQNVPYKFALYHVGAYPSIRSYNNSMAKKIRKFWVPAFEKFNLTAAFEHHDHAYKRTYPLLNNKIDPKGVLYLGDGAWGVEKPRKSKRAENKWYLAKSEPKQHFIYVQIDNNKRLYQAIDSNGHVFDEYIQR